jgi:DNA mismatch repair protein MutL
LTTLEVPLVETAHSRASAPRKIRLLAQEVIHRIAAGEVVDRPASVLKELLDNSIDAGADKTRVLISDGGLRLLEVEDNGCGMSREDLELCLLRHATSKISSLEELDAISSLGFRGEALAAISSVSKLKMESAQANEESWLLETLGGTQPKIIPASARRGTRTQVSDLFFNVPARKKFLKALGSELNECLEVLNAVALAHPEISFEWHALDHESGEVKKAGLWPAGTLIERFRQVHGHDGEILYVDHTPSAPEIIRAQIAVYRPPVSSPFQKSIHLSVNGRPVMDKRLPYALRESLSGLIEMGRYPILQANLDVDVHSVDVNIHPQKKEIRWPANFSLASFLYSILRPQFEVRTPMPTAPAHQSGLFTSPGFSAIPATAPFAPISTDKTELSHSPELRPPSSESPSDRIGTFETDAPRIFSPAPKLRAPLESRPAFRFSELRIIGEASASWLLCESVNGLIVIDQHAAHERVNYEKILCRPQLLRSKPLLIPVPVPKDLEWEGLQADFQRALEDLSFEFSDDGAQIIAVPEADRKMAWGELFHDILDELRSGSLHVNRAQEFKQKIAASLSCHGSVRRGQRLTHDEIRALLKSMDEVQWGGLCPHGRPVWLELNNRFLEESFHR